MRVIEVDTASDPMAWKQVQVIKGVDFEAELIEAALQRSLSDRPYLSGYALESISNLFADLGLKLVFRKGEKTV